MYEYTRMPFGPVNGTAVFQHTMDTVFSDYLQDFLTIFVDDICGFAASADAHIRNLRRVFQRCRQYRLRLKRTKCDFALKCVDFLGYVAGPSGYTMAESRRQGLERLARRRVHKVLVPKQPGLCSSERGVPVAQSRPKQRGGPAWVVALDEELGELVAATRRRQHPV